MKKVRSELAEKVVELSHNKSLEGALLEWDIDDFWEDQDHKTQCLCGHEGLRCCYGIKNRLTGESLKPIGSTCITKFGNSNLSSQLRFYAMLRKLLLAYESREWIELSTEYFSKPFIEWLGSQGCFEKNEYNNFDPWNDVSFLTSRFGKNKYPSAGEKKKIFALVSKQIIPFAKQLLNKH